MSLFKKYKEDFSSINEKYRQDRVESNSKERVLQKDNSADIPVPNPYYKVRDIINVEQSLAEQAYGIDKLALSWNSNSSFRKTPFSFKAVRNVNDSDQIFSGNKYYERVKDPNDRLYLFKDYSNGAFFDGLPKNSIYFLPPSKEGEDPEFVKELYGNDIFLAKELGTIFGVNGDRSGKFVRRKYQAGGRIFSELRSRFIAASVDAARVFAAGPDTAADSVLSIFSPRKETAFYNKDLLTLQVMGSPLGQHLRMRTSLADFYARPKMGTSDSLLPTAFINTPAHFFQATPIRFGLGALNAALKIGSQLWGGGMINQTNYESVEKDINDKLRESNIFETPPSSKESPLWIRTIVPKDNMKDFVLRPLTSYFEKDELGFKVDKISIGGYRRPVSSTPSKTPLADGVINNFFSNFANLSDDVSFNVINFGEYSARKQIDEVYYNEISDVRDDMVNDGTNPFIDDLITLGFVYFDKNLKYSKYLQFRALLSQVQETVNPDWNVGKYLGHPLNYHTYKGVNRDVQFTFKVHTYSKKELASMWIKLNKLSSLCYPQYTNIGVGEESLDQISFSRMQGPIIRLHLGSMYKNIPGYIKSLTYSVDSSTPWETEGGFETPHIMEVTCNYTIIGHVLPELDNINSFDVFRTKRFDTSKGEYKTSGKHTIAFQENRPKFTLSAGNIVEELIGA